MTHRDYIEELAAMGQLEEAVKEFLRGARIVGGQIKMDALGISGRYNSYANRVNSGVEDNDDLERTKNGLRIALLGIIKRYNPPAGITFGDAGEGKVTEKGKLPTEKQGADLAADSGKPKVFISYSHSDQKVAQKMKKALEAADIEVFIDADYLKPGTSIADFIQDMINRTDATISIVSKRSLLSGWVGMESDLTLQHEKFKADKQFIACAIDLEFFDDLFVFNSLKEIDKKVKDYQSKIDEVRAMNNLIDTSDLENKRDLQRDLLINLPKIINRLNRFYTVDIVVNTEKNIDNFDNGVEQVIKALKE
ncbi:MAG: TIR domain-containing protein [Bacteroidota bacterium]